jgi:uncharacterized protein (TIGR03083 family)
MNTTATRVQDVRPLSPGEAKGLATAEYDRCLDLLRSLSPDEWSRPTECDPWDVKVLAGHVLGMAERYVSPEEEVRQSKLAGEAAQQAGVTMLDALTGLQAREHGGRSPSDLITRFTAAAPRAVAGRMGASADERAMTFNPGPPINEEWTRGYLLDVILTRDPWMHRVDISRAIGREPVLTAAHDGRIVADVVAEWARRHGQPFTLTLTGPAGGSFVAGESGENLELDAVEFCRILSGRAQGAGLLSTEVPF